MTIVFKVLTHKIEVCFFIQKRDHLGSRYIYIYLHTQSQFVVRKHPGLIGILTKDLMQDPLDLGLKEHKGGCLSLLAKFGLVQ